MNFPTNVKYTSEHEWIRIEGDEAIVGITDYAQDQLGDIVFIDWEADRDPDHVGVVLSIVEEKNENGYIKDYIYTIEGNTAGIVAVRRYPLDSKYILGYGVIDWVRTEVESEPNP